MSRPRPGATFTGAAGDLDQGSLGGAHREGAAVETADALERLFAAAPR